MFRLLLSFFSCIFLTFTIPAIAFCQDPPPSQDSEIGYISDFLIINVRDHIESPFSVVTAVRSNDQVRILKEQGKYFFIETADNKQGWISKQYVTTKTPKPQIIDNLKQELKSLKETYSADCPEVAFNDSYGTPPPIESTTSSCESEQNALTESLAHIEELETQLNICAEQLRGDNSSDQLCPQLPEIEALQNNLKKSQQRYVTLSQEYKKRETKIASLENKLAKQNDKTRLYWFGAGALVFFIGLLFGRIQSKKRDRYIY